MNAFKHLIFCFKHCVKLTVVLLAFSMQPTFAKCKTNSPILRATDTCNYCESMSFGEVHGNGLYRIIHVKGCKKDGKFLGGAPGNGTFNVVRTTWDKKSLFIIGNALCSGSKAYCFGLTP